MMQHYPPRPGAPQTPGAPQSGIQQLPANPASPAPISEPKRISLLEAAESYAAMGLPIFALKPNRTEPLHRPGQESASTQRKQIRDWWKHQPKANIGLKLAPGFVVLDLCGMAGLYFLWSRLWDKSTDLPPTPTIICQNHLQLIYLTPADILLPSHHQLSDLGAEIIMTPNILILPPSVVAERNVKWFHDASLVTTKPQWLPNWIITLLRRREKQNSTK